MATQWYYADAQNQQQGPVDGLAIARGYRAGQLKPETLVWREGLANWVALRSIAAQFGLVIVGAPAASTPARQASDGGVRIVKPSGGTRWGIFIAVGALGLIFVLAILAAIALPAYQDYTLRAKVTQVAIVADGLKTEIAEFRLDQQRCPVNGDTGFGTPESYATPVIVTAQIGALKGGECAVEFALGGTGASTLAGKKIRYALGADGSWSVSSNLAQRYLPQSMRR